MSKTKKELNLVDRVLIECHYAEQFSLRAIRSRYFMNRGVVVKDDDGERISSNVLSANISKLEKSGYVEKIKGLKNGERRLTVSGRDRVDTLVQP
jgi:ribosomal protein S19E (S16A)